MPQFCVSPGFLFKNAAPLPLLQTLQATLTKVVLLFFNALTSRIGGSPKNLLYSRQNWLMLS